MPLGVREGRSQGGEEVQLRSIDLDKDWKELDNLFRKYPMDGAAKKALRKAGGTYIWTFLQTFKPRESSNGDYSAQAICYLGKLKLTSSMAIPPQR